MRRIIRFGTALTTLGLLFAYHRYQQEKGTALTRLRAGSRIAETSLGSLEYAVEGKGQPFLIMHGSGGGYEQGLLFTRILSPQTCQTIAVSRPGYHQTPLTTGQTPAEQADACAALLDELVIEKAAVLGISAGGMSAIQFALRHPDRCRALILLSAVGPAIQNIHAPTWMVSVLRFIMSSDFIIWLMLKLSSKSLVGTMTGKIALDHTQDIEGARIIDAIVQGLFPASLWRDGTINDIEQVIHLSLEALRNITVPTLVIHGTNDAMIPYGVAQSTANYIPNAKLITIEDGSHLVIGTHKKIIGTAVEEFVSQQK